MFCLILAGESAPQLNFMSVSSCSALTVSELSKLPVQYLPAGVTVISLSVFVMLRAVKRSPFPRPAFILASKVLNAIRAMKQTVKWALMRSSRLRKTGRALNSDLRRAKLSSVSQRPRLISAISSARFPVPVSGSYMSNPGLA